VAETIIDGERSTLAASTAGRLTHLTLYDGDPEAGGSEALNLAARQTVAWSAGSAGVQNISNAPRVITLNGATTFDYLVGMTALSGGTAITKKSIGSTTFGAGGGTVTVSSGSITITSA